MLPAAVPPLPNRVFLSLAPSVPGLIAAVKAFLLKPFFSPLLKQSLPSTLPSCAQVIANAPATGLYCFVFWRAPAAPSVILVVLSGDICSSLWIPLAHTGQSGSRQTCVHWRCQLVPQHRGSRRWNCTSRRWWREAVPQDGACTMLQVSVLPLLMNTHTMLSPFSR